MVKHECTLYSLIELANIPYKKLERWTDLKLLDLLKDLQGKTNIEIHILFQKCVYSCNLSLNFSMDQT